MKNLTSIRPVWNKICAHFGFQITGAHFLDFANLHLEADKRPEDLYQRLMAFVEDTLLRANSLSHHGEATTEDEELTPTFRVLIKRRQPAKKPATLNLEPSTLRL